ncbi:MAG: FAD:protein FMN transferase [Gammaproteobacteria bacterium]|nr:FAD:protein FMN transferase [Gammaproteobacteria bacterium]
MRWPAKLAFAALTTALVTACSESSRQLPVAELSGSAMGTAYSVKIVSPPDGLDVAALQQEVDQQLAGIEQQMSTYIADSELSSFNAHRGMDWFEVSGELCRLVADALSISAASGGAFDITVGPLVNLWGFGPDGSAAEPPDAHLIAVLLDSVGSAALHADCSMPALRKNCPDVYVDLSAIAKGYGVDRLAALLDGRELRNYLVEIGGELRVRGKNAKADAWAVAIEAPLRSGRSVHAIVKVTDAAVATSGDYRNYFEHDGSVYSHTIDPRTGYPVAHTAASVTVVADEAAFADAMATALLVLGPEDGLALAERDGIAAYYLVRQDGAIDARLSSKFAAEVRLQ